MLNTVRAEKTDIEERSQKRLHEKDQNRIGPEKEKRCRKNSSLPPQLK